MRVSHAVTTVFDDPNLVSCAGLAPVLQLAERAGLQDLVGEHVHLGQPGGVNPHLKIPSLVAGMIAGADSIADMTLLRHGAMSRLFAGVRAPSTLGTFLRSFTFGHVRQLDAVASRLLINLAGQAPLLPGADELAYLDVDDTLKQTYGYAKQGAGRGYTGVKGLNALLAIVSTPSSAPVIAAARLRKGGANLARGAARFVTDALITAKKAGASDLQPYVGKELEAKIIELDKNRNNVVLSRRQWLEQTQSEVRSTFPAMLQKSQVRSGVVSSIVNFGAFVDLGGVDGLVHASELSWKHIDHPSEVVEVGQEVTVEVLDVDLDRERVSLSLKATQEDPWQQFARTHAIAQVVPGDPAAPRPAPAASGGTLASDEALQALREKLSGGAS